MVAVLSFAGSDITPLHAITTTRRCAVGATAIAIDLVAVVAGFDIRVTVGAGTYKAIAASSHPAMHRAAVVAAAISIVTFFVALAANAGVLKDAPIAAFRTQAGVGAAIVISIVAVIAGFVAFLQWVEVAPGDAIAAAGVGTLTGACVEIDQVGVVAGLSRTDHAIATYRGDHYPARTRNSGKR